MLTCRGPAQGAVSVMRSVFKVGPDSTYKKKTVVLEWAAVLVYNTFLGLFVWHYGIQSPDKNKYHHVILLMFHVIDVLNTENE